MSNALSPHGLAALSVLLAGASIAHAQAGPRPTTIVVSDALTLSPVARPLPNPGGDIADAPSVGLIGLLLPAVQKYNAVSHAASPRLAPNFGDIDITSYRAPAGVTHEYHRVAGILPKGQMPYYTQAAHHTTNTLGENKFRFTDSLILGAGPGAEGAVHVLPINDPPTATARTFFPYGPSFSGGVRVAVGDINGDGVDEIITGAGPGAGPHVKVFDGKTGAEVASFFAYNPGFQGGVSVAIGDINGDGQTDIITGSGAGGAPHVKVFDGNTVRAAGGSPDIIPTLPAHHDVFLPPAYAFTDVFVTAGDLDGDGKAEIVLNPAGKLRQPGRPVYGNITFLHEAPSTSSLLPSLEVAGMLSIPADAFGPDYDGGFIAIPEDIDGSTDGAELVITAFSGFIPEPAAAMPLVAAAALLTSRRRR